MYKLLSRNSKVWLFLFTSVYSHNIFAAEGVGVDLDGSGAPDFEIVDLGADGKRGGGDDILMPYGQAYGYPYPYYVDTNSDGRPDLFYHYEPSANGGRGGYIATPISTLARPVTTTTNPNDLANALIDAREQAANNAGDNTVKAPAPDEDEFRSLRNFNSGFNSILSDSLRPLKDVRMLQTVSPYNPNATGNHLEEILETLAKHGPVSLPMDEKRVWVSPFYSIGRQKTMPDKVGNKNWLSGATMGAEYRNLKQEWTAGFMSGLNYGRQEELGNAQSFTKTKGLTFGGYHSMGFLGGGRYDIMASRTVSFQDNQRHAISAENTDYYAISDHKMYTDTVDFKLTYRFVLDHTWSVRPSLGNTYIHNQSGSYSERGAGLYNQNVRDTNSRSNEVYGGIGARAGWKNGNKKIRITGVYEYGYQYEQSGSPTVVTLNITGVAPVVTNQSNKKTKTHYVSWNATYYDGDTNFKFLIGYSGAYQEEQKNHSLTLKAEYRF